MNDEIIIKIIVALSVILGTIAVGVSLFARDEWPEIFEEDDNAPSDTTSNL